VPTDPDAADFTANLPGIPTEKLALSMNNGADTAPRSDGAEYVHL